ncbi:uncharacterized protein LOC136070178 isoform X1 [Quercus suber]|uniref:uncharacterized protein LOC136070178 isoform X1 n=1 Tax=Quercus suber TaxID=58331 RepID=UPI0032DF20F7
MLEESESEDEPEPLSIYRPTIELSVPMGTPIEGLFGRVKFATLAPFAATRGVFAEATTSPIGPVPIDEGTHIGKRSEEILEDPEDEPILGRRISESEEEERAPPEIEFMGPPLTVLSQFEVVSNSTTIPNPASEATAFFARFDQPEVNDLGPADFWGSGPPYIDFHCFRIPEDCSSQLVTIYSNRGDFMHGFRLDCSAREHFLRMLGSVLNDIKHNFVDTVSIERILQWNAAVQELVSVGFAVKFILDHLREIARAVFMRTVQPDVDAINSRLEILRKEVVDLEDRRERLISSTGGSNHFGDQPLISGLY